MKDLLSNFDDGIVLSNSASIWDNSAGCENLFLVLDFFRMIKSDDEKKLETRIIEFVLDDDGVGSWVK